tara:strand:+ start:439 stop:618 length:180 start_codon:yes stop_codon:yes gene_type:complete
MTSPKTYEITEAQLNAIHEALDRLNGLLHGPAELEAEQDSAQALAFALRSSALPTKEVE